MKDYSLLSNRRDNMKVRPFNKKVDTATLKTWLNLNGADEYYADSLPRRGFLVFTEEMEVAVAFYRRCEGGLAIIEGLCTTPKASKEDRNAAIDLLFKTIEGDLKAKKFSIIAATCLNSQTLTRAPRYGFEQVEMPLVVKYIE